MHNILVIGSVTKDVFFPTNEGLILETPNDLLSQRKIAFELGAKYHIQNIHETLGGCSVNVAAGLAKLGEKVECYCPVGHDAAGRWIRSELIAQGIDAKHLVILEEKKSDQSTIIVDERSGERTIFSFHNASENFEVLAEKIERPEWIFVGDLSGQWQKNLDTILEIAKNKRIKIAFNPRQKSIHDDPNKIMQALGSTDILFVNKDEAIEIVSNCGDITVKELLENEEYLLKVLFRLGAKNVTITDGIRGAWGWNGYELLHVDAMPQEAVDTTGAGDAFASGFLAASIKQKDLAEALKWGIANSSSSVTEYGGQAGLLDEDQIKDFIKKL